jgi:hypothetical protein
VYTHTHTPTRIYAVRRMCSMNAGVKKSPLKVSPRKKKGK